MISFRFTATVFVLININICDAANFKNITGSSQPLREGDFLLSSSTFILGFFSPANSTSKYIGIWYNNMPTQDIVWVANRDSPISNGTTGLLAFSNDGNLILSDSTGAVHWSTNASIPASNNNSVAFLTNSGNLILSDVVTGKKWWQSFEHPTDTYLAGMKVLINRRMGLRKVFTSWKSVNDPSPGRFTIGVDPRGSPQYVLLDEFDNRRWRSGHWNGLQFVGAPNVTTNYLYGAKLSDVDSNGNMYFTYTAANFSRLFRFVITHDGNEELLFWKQKAHKWTVVQSLPESDCDFYNKCGKFATCSGNSKCDCIKGFEPEDPKEWQVGNWSRGCMRSTPLQCEVNNSMSKGSDGFLQVKNVKLPDFADFAERILDFDECKQLCLMNCSCKAYVMTSGLGCFTWSQDLVDIQKFLDDSGTGETLYVRLAGSELASWITSTMFTIVIVLLAAVTLVIFAFAIYIFRKKHKPDDKLPSPETTNNNTTLMHTVSKNGEHFAGFPDQENIVGESSDGNGSDVPLLHFDTLALATNNFSNENKLGQGGFGPVYMGKLPSGQDIAVKRLSVKSGQGCEEFRNEIILISKLQHRNLVRLLGWCMQGDEKMLIYEYMPNKSLDFFLFNPVRRPKLEWNTRFNVIEGIARGLLYLHRDSRLRIIHRDMKASNILLDSEMNPKISDFGMARIFGCNQNEANTARVVGTYGYMAPEYAMDGLFSVKSDVYSFGVLLLEIISGRKNTSFHLSENPHLVRYAWSMWLQDTAVELIDPSIKDSCDLNQVLRCIHIGMLCLQDSAAHRPDMSTVIIMLESETTPLPAPIPTTLGALNSSLETVWSAGKGIETASKGIETVSSSSEVTIVSDLSAR